MSIYLLAVLQWYAVVIGLSHFVNMQMMSFQSSPSLSINVSDYVVTSCAAY